MYRPYGKSSQPNHRQFCTLEYWNTYHSIISMNDIYLDKFKLQQRHITMSKFTQIGRVDTYSRSKKTYTVERIVYTTIVHVAQVFRASNTINPSLDNDGKTCFILQEYHRKYINQDGTRRKHKALLQLTIRKIEDLAIPH